MDYEGECAICGVEGYWAKAWIDVTGFLCSACDRNENKKVRQGMLFV